MSWAGIQIINFKNIAYFFQFESTLRKFCCCFTPAEPDFVNQKFYLKKYPAFTAAVCKSYLKKRA